MSTNERQAPLTPLRAIRLAAGLSLAEVGRRAGINKGRLSIIERGVSPTEDEARAIWRVLSGDGAPERLVPVPGIEQPESVA